MAKFAVVLLWLVGSATFAQAQSPKPDVWEPLRFLAGEWQGTATGEPGTGTAARRYEFVLNGRFLHERNTSTFPPQEKNKTGEVHEHWSLFSYDKKRKTILFRQFHQESFVVTYALNPALSSPSRFVFESEQVENIPSTWKARETYELISNNEFTETFELAQSDKPFAVYSRNHFKRRQP
ncbi:MAG TPA: hypothetical protein VGK03_12820 [Geothrix sp.]|jgi:hypothetical protein